MSNVNSSGHFLDVEKEVYIYIGRLGGGSLILPSSYIYFYIDTSSVDRVFFIR